MAEHDYVIDNQSAPSFRADLNNALQAIVSNNSKGTAPTVTYANMTWYDTATNWIFVRNETNSAWIRFAYLDQATNKISLVDDTKVVNTSGTQTGLLGDQTTATWQAGTGTTQSLVSPANVKSAITALSPSQVKVWVNWNTVGTLSVRASLNVSSVTDLGINISRVNFTTAMPNANYAAVANARRNNDTLSEAMAATCTNYLTTSVTVVAFSSSTGPTENIFNTLVVVQ